MKKIKFLLVFGLLVCLALNASSKTVNHIVNFAPDLKIDSVIANDGNIYSTLSLQNCGQTSIEGTPQLPVKIIKLIIPADEESDYVVCSKSKSMILQLKYPIFPVQKPIPTIIGFIGNEFVKPQKEVYSSNTFIPQDQVRIIRTNYIRGNKIVVIEIMPVLYNPVTNQVEFSENVDITLKLKSSEKKPVTSQVKNKGKWDNYLKTLVDNNSDVDLYSVIEARNDSGEEYKLKSAKSTQGISIYCEYVVIAPSSLSTYLNNFIQWKRQKGIDIELVTTEAISQNYSGDLISGINDEAGKIRQFLYDAYDNGLEFALLVGDNNTVPIRYGTGYDNTWTLSVTNDCKIPTDLYFSDFNGDWNIDSDQYLGEETGDYVDYGAEIFVGRLLCTANDGSSVDNWSVKLLNYEKDPGNGSTSYLTRAFYTQADQLQDLDQANDIISHFNNFFTTNNVFEEIYNGVPDFNSAESPQFPTGNETVAEMNDGYGFISWFNHGSPDNVAVATKGLNDCGNNDKKKVTNFNSTQGYCGYSENLNGLDNLSNTNKPFILYTIACETMPFDTWNSVSPVNNMGAKVTMQQARGGSSYLGNTRYGYVYDSWYMQQEFTNLLVGGTFTLGVAEANSKGSSGDHFVWLSHNLLGCPETEIWSSSLSQFTNASINDTGSTVYVSTGGVSNCTISIISKYDYGVSYQSAVEGVSQNTFYNVPNDYIVTITKHNYKPRIF